MSRRVFAVVVQVHSPSFVLYWESNEVNVFGSAGFGLFCIIGCVNLLMAFVIGIFQFSGVIYSV